VRPAATRTVTVWWPDWPVVAAGAGLAADAVPAAVLHANRVVARSPSAAAAGVQIGHRRRQAQVRCPDLQLHDHDPDRDARAFEPIVRAVAELAPRLEVIAPGWLYLAARGPSRYFGGDAALAARLAEVVGGAAPATAALAGRATGPGIGVADGRFAAAAAARLAAIERTAIRVVAPGGSGAFCAGLGVHWLVELGEADDELVGLLLRLGLSTLGDVAALATTDLLARFGPAGAHVHRLATGADAHPPGTSDPPPDRVVEQAFDDPVMQLDALVFTAKQLADELAGRLAAEGRVCTRLVVVAETEHGERSERVWYRAAGLPAAAMVERARWQLEGWAAQPGGLSGGVVLLRLHPELVRGDDGDQLGLWGGWSQVDEAAVRAVTRLVGLVGEDAVRVPAWRGGRLPGERYQWVPATTTSLDAPAERLAAGDGPWPGALASPAPGRVLRAPQAAELVDAAGAPVAVTGRGEPTAVPARLRVGAVERAVVAWAGPWPVDQRWWEPRMRRRLARFQVVTDDGQAYQVHAEHRQWWIAAIYA
jgi:protein ImuB